MKVLMKGNEALAEAAIRAGCHHFFGYPITPQTEVAGLYVQAHAQGGRHVPPGRDPRSPPSTWCYGAAAAGVRAMTSSSSPGISLKSEGISYMAGADLPCVIVNVQRGGPGLGGIQPAQADYYQATTRRAATATSSMLVLAPSTVQEMVDLIHAGLRHWPTSTACPP